MIKPGNPADFDPAFTDGVVSLFHQAFDDLRPDEQAVSINLVAGVLTEQLSQRGRRADAAGYLAVIQELQPATIEQTWHMVMDPARERLSVTDQNRLEYIGLAIVRMQRQHASLNADNF